MNYVKVFKNLLVYQKKFLLQLNLMSI